MTLVCEMATTSNQASSWPAVPEYSQYIKGGDVSFEAAITAVLRTAEKLVPEVPRSAEKTDTDIIEEHAGRLRSFPPWEVLAEYADLEGFGVRSGVPLGAMRASYSIAPTFTDERHLSVRDYIWNARIRRVAAALPRTLMPHLMFRPVRLVPAVNMAPEYAGAQQRILHELNCGGRVKILELLHLGFAFEHYGDGPPLP